MPRLLVTVSIWCFLEKEGSRIGVPLSLRGMVRSCVRYTLSHSRVGVSWYELPMLRPTAVNHSWLERRP